MSVECPQFTELVKVISDKLSELSDEEMGGVEYYGKEPPHANYYCELDGVNYSIAVYSSYESKDTK